ncbi:MAG: ribonuclease HII [Gammaproteobacteria bacterium CG_4_10_14_0_8_um_filter_38_16]|nr:MAG: ribonuclease HII [Gammaproteobacteria bacterium CG_4_10_14_0_8_um_filter_38_16]PJA02659.1 MAG: ribonuclease HII [Gammaproteobacteria bacterium CG_4_10_14_0_2_um_filter_38_22]PJB09873.1 MAG: ribonuclease HII [Gammaproteobacteria bacterium CG_4_9_14_3_um_filter_38_9]
MAHIENHKITLIAGVDEAGRGPLAGAVVAAAVILNPLCQIDGLTDSKLLSEKKREQLFVEITEKAISYGIAQASVSEIDEMNILQATLLAMRRAVAQLAIEPHEVWVDGNQDPKCDYPTKLIVQGDFLISAISAASILAKVTRDRLMKALDVQFPGYGFAKHKGYGTKAHRIALQKLGATIHHRRSFAPVREVMLAT